jgi:methylisocitrate lyase
VSQGHKLRQILETSDILVLPGIYDCLGAKLVEEIGFPAAFTSGFGISATTLGLPDYGFLTATETLDRVGKIAQSTNIPIVADLDTGYGNPLNVIRTVTDAIRLGIAGIILEDQEWPKKCGHFSGKSVISEAEHVQKIKAAVSVKQDSGLVIIARTDARATLGLDEAIKRGKSYYEAGADIVFIEAPQSVDELTAIAAAFPKIPLLVNMIEGGKTPCLSQAELKQLGFKIVVYPLSGLFAATQAMLKCWQYLKEHGTTDRQEDVVDFQQFEKSIDVAKYRNLESQFKG